MFNNVKLKELRKNAGFTQLQMAQRINVARATYDIKAKQVDYTNKRNKIERKIARLKDLYINELITMEEYKADLGKFNAELDKIPTDTVKVDLKAIEMLLNMDINSLYYELTCEERQVLIRSVVKSITIDAENKMSLEFI